MTTDVDEAREALLAGIVDDESGMETFDDALVDVLIAAVRAECNEAGAYRRGAAERRLTRSSPLPRPRGSGRERG